MTLDERDLERLGGGELDLDETPIPEVTTDEPAEERDELAQRRRGRPPGRLGMKRDAKPEKARVRTLRERMAALKAKKHQRTSDDKPRPAAPIIPQNIPPLESGSELVDDIDEGTAAAMGADGYLRWPTADRTTVKLPFIEAPELAPEPAQEDTVDEHEWLTRAQACERLGVGLTKFWELSRTAKLTTKRTERSPRGGNPGMLYRADQIDKLALERAKKPARARAARPAAAPAPELPSDDVHTEEAPPDAVQRVARLVLGIVRTVQDLVHSCAIDKDRHGQVLGAVLKALLEG